MVDRAPGDASSHPGADGATPRVPGDPESPEEVLARLLEYLARTRPRAPDANGNGRDGQAACLRRPVVIVRHPMRMPRFEDLRPDSDQTR